MSVTTLPVARPAPPAAHSGSLIPSTINEAMQLANMMAKARMVPKHLQDDPGSCFMVVEQAQRWQMSPFAVAQCTSNIGGKLCYEGKLIAAAVSSTGAISGEFDYEYSGDPLKPETLSVKASAVRASDGQRKEIVLRWADAKTENKYWKLQPEQQLCYAASRVWARRWTPGPLLGVYAPEEMDQRQPDAFTGQTIDAEPVAPEPPQPAPPKKGITVGDRLTAFEKELTAAVEAGAEAVDTLLAREDVNKLRDYVSNGAKTRMEAAIADALARTAPAFDGELAESAP